MLPHDGAGGLVVDVEVARGVAQDLRRHRDGFTIRGKDRPGEGVGARGVTDAQRRFVLRGVVDVHREHGPEELVAHGAVLRVPGHDDRRANEPAVRALVRENAQLVDVLPPAEYKDEHIADAVSIPLRQLDRESTRALDPGRPVGHCHHRALLNSAGAGFGHDRAIVSHGVPVCPIGGAKQRSRRV